MVRTDARKELETRAGVQSCWLKTRRILSKRSQANPVRMLFHRWFSQPVAALDAAGGAGTIVGYTLTGAMPRDLRPVHIMGEPYRGLLCPSRDDEAPLIRSR